MYYKLINLLISANFINSAVSISATNCFLDICKAASWRTKSTSNLGTLTSFDLLTIIFIFKTTGFNTTQTKIIEVNWICKYHRYLVTMNMKYSLNSKGSSFMLKLLSPDRIISCQSDTIVLLVYNKVEHIVLQ